MEKNAFCRRWFFCSGKQKSAGKQYIQNIGENASQHFVHLYTEWARIGLDFSPFKPLYNVQ
jgi:hypothetical protein